MKKGLRFKGNLKNYLRWPLILSLLMLVAEVHIYQLNKRSGLVLLIYTVLCILFSMFLWFFGRYKLQADLIEFAQSYDTIQMKMLKEMSIPFAVINTEGHLLWGNDDFLEIIVNRKAARRNLSNIFPELTADKLPGAGDGEVQVHVTREDHCYLGVMRYIDTGELEEEEKLPEIDQFFEEQQLIVLFLYEETRMVELEKQINAQQMVVGLLYIDNYEEMLENIDEVRQPLLSAMVDRRINKYMQGIDAISKKMEKDKYLFIFRQEFLDELRKTRFPILEEIRSINIGNDQTCTISIGIGAQEDTYAEKYNNARAAIDLALGRGGDQAVVKAGDEEEFFGGKRVSVERNTRVKARVKAHALKELIEGKERVVVMGHNIGDPDSFGASAGIYRIAKALGRKAHIVLNECSPSVKPLRDRFYAGDYEAEAILDRKQAAELMDENTLLIIVDVNKLDYTECPELIGLADSIVVIDHHRQAGDVSRNTKLFYVEPYASSACEMVTELCQYMDVDLKLKSAEAEAMYAGIMIDTNYFTNKTGSRTFEAMAYLHRSGVDVMRLRKAFRDDMQEYRLKAEAIQATMLYLDHYAIAENKPPADFEGPTILAAKIANELLEIQGVKASFVITAVGENVQISARSIDEVNVQIMMERLGGGGHINMAGAQMKQSTVQEAKDKVRALIDEMIAQGEITEEQP